MLLEETYSNGHPLAAETLRREDPVAHNGSTLIELFKSATLWTLPASGAAVVLSTQLSGYQWVQICIAGAIALQLAFMLNYGFHKETRRLNFLVMQLLAYEIFVVCWQIWLAYPKANLVMVIPMAVYIAGVTNEVRHSFRRTQELLVNPDFIDPPAPLPKDAKSPFFFPHTSSWKFYSAEGIRAALGAGLWGIGYGITTPGFSQFNQLTGVMVGCDALFAALGKLAEDYMDRKNREVKQSREVGRFSVQIPLLNKILLAMTESIGGLQKLSSFVSPFFVMNDIWSFISLGIVSGAIRQHKQRQFERSDLKGTSFEYYRDPQAAKRVAMVAAAFFAIIVPVFTFRCLVKKTCDAPTLFSAEVIVAGMYLSFALYTLIEYRWRGKIQGNIPFEHRGKGLTTSRFALCEYSDWIAYGSVICLHIAKKELGSNGFQMAMWLLGYGFLSAAMGNDLARMSDIHLTDWDVPSLSPVANIVFSRFLGEIILNSIGKG